MLSATYSGRFPRCTRAAAAVIVATIVPALGVIACHDTSSSAEEGPRLVYGAAVALGNGHARSYVLFDSADTDKPIEFGVAFNEAAMEGLPAPMSMPGGGDDPHAHADFHEYLLPLPAQNPTPYKLIELDWNPGGHEPPGIYDIPHFDFHFYTITKEQRDAIDPSIGDSAYMARSGSLPPADHRPEFFVPLAAPETPIVAVPRMGVHWSDVRSPELQGALGHPENAHTFTTTYIHGSWNGEFIFDEPMVTRAFIMGRKTANTDAARDSVMQLPVAARTGTAGYYPSAYRVAYDSESGEYRIALTQLGWRE